MNLIDLIIGLVLSVVDRLERVKQFFPLVWRPILSYDGARKLLRLSGTGRLIDHL